MDIGMVKILVFLTNLFQSSILVLFNLFKYINLSSQPIATNNY